MQEYFKKHAENVLPPSEYIRYINSVHRVSRQVLDFQP